MGKKGFNLAELAREAMGETAPVSISDTVQEISAARITPNAANFYEMSDLEELAASIELVGLMTPIQVKPAGAPLEYVIIDGERRFRALTQVLGRETVPCIVRTPVNDVIEELMLIEANRTQRRMSPADLSRQAERYTELLARLRDAGVEIPGRLRDRVAEALDVSASKLGRLHAIRANLIPVLLQAFDAGSLSESKAYEISKTPEAFQRTLIDREPWFFAQMNVSLALETWEWRQRIEQAREPEPDPDPAPEAVSNSDTQNPDPAPVSNSDTPDERPIGEPQRRYSILRAAEALGIDVNRPFTTTVKALAIGGKIYEGIVNDDVVVALTPRGVRLGYINSPDRKDYSFKEFVTILQELLWERAILGETLGVPNSDTPPSGLDWRDRRDDGPPPEDAMAVIFWTPDHGFIFPPSHLIQQYIKTMPEMTTYWAVVTGPKE